MNNKSEKYPWLKHITAKDIHNGYKWCDRCLWEGKKVLAVYKAYGTKVCEEHAQVYNDELKTEFSGDYTEADYQSWKKLQEER